MVVEVEHDENKGKQACAESMGKTMSRELAPFVCQTIGAAAKTTRNNRPLFQRTGEDIAKKRAEGRRRRRRRRREARVFRGWRSVGRERERGRRACLWPLEISLID